MRRFGVKKTRKSKFFQGEMMTCRNCGRQEKSDKHVSSQWTVVELDGRALYFCPWCFGNARAAGLGSAP